MRYLNKVIIIIIIIIIVFIILLLLIIIIDDDADFALVLWYRSKNYRCKKREKIRKAKSRLDLFL